MEPVVVEESLLLHTNILVRLFQYMNLRLFNCASFCAVCDTKQAIDTVKPMPCTKELCVHT